jgi:hypothetical protein
MENPYNNDVSCGVEPMRATILLTMALSLTGPVMAQEPSRSTLKPPPTADADTSQPRQRLVTVFGNEECPKPTSPDEVVVCARLPDSEIYRIPKQLRSADNRRVSPFQANRALLLGDASGGAGGSIGSCSAVGAGGMIGCSQQQVDAWAQDRTSRMQTGRTEIPED